MIMSSQVVVASDALLRAKEWTRLDPNQTTLTYVQTLITQSEEGNNDDALNELETLFVW